MKKYLISIFISCLFSVSVFGQLPRIQMEGIYSTVVTTVTRCVGDTVKMSCTHNGNTVQARWYVSTDNFVTWRLAIGGFYYNPLISDTIKYYKAITSYDNIETPIITLCKKPSPNKPIITSGDSIFCQISDTLTYISMLDTNSVSYSWIFPAGSNIISGNANDTIKVSSLTTGNIIIKGINSCNVISDSLVYHINGETKAIPSPISGIDNVCKGQNSITYNINPIPGYPSSYQWNLPTGCQINSYNNNHITVSYNTNAISGNVKVKPVNSCGVGDSSYLFVTVNNLPTAPTISAPAICSKNGIFTITGTAGNTVTYTGITGTPVSPVTIGVGGTVAVTDTNVISNKTITIASVSNGTCTLTPMNLTATVTNL